MGSEDVPTPFCQSSRQTHRGRSIIQLQGSSYNSWRPVFFLFLFFWGRGGGGASFCFSFERRCVYALISQPGLAPDILTTHQTQPLLDSWARKVIAPARRSSIISPTHRERGEIPSVNSAVFNLSGPRSVSMDFLGRWESASKHHVQSKLSSNKFGLWSHNTETWCKLSHTFSWGGHRSRSKPRCISVQGTSKLSQSLRLHAHYQTITQAHGQN